MKTKRLTKSLTVNVLSQFWNLFSLRPMEPGKHLFCWWCGSRKYIANWVILNAQCSEPSVSTGAAKSGTDLACLIIVCEGFEHAHHSSRYLTLRCLTLQFQKLDNTVMCRWLCEEHWVTNAVALFAFFFYTFNTELKVAERGLFSHVTASESCDLGRSVARASLISWLRNCNFHVTQAILSTAHTWGNSRERRWAHMCPILAFPSIKTN